MPSSEEGYFMVRSTSAPAGKCLKSDVERFDRNLRLANETSLADPIVSDTSPSETCLASRNFPILTEARENQDP